MLQRQETRHHRMKWIDYNETYGARVLARMFRQIGPINTAVDIGAGFGYDLSLLADFHPEARRIAVESAPECCAALKGQVDEILPLDIERDTFPFEPGSVDLIMANQVLEHTKEVFWIFDQISRSLKVGGHLIFGVPNVLSLHNRLLSFAGVHPTQHQLASAHVRPFSKKDTIAFMDRCSGGIFKLKAFGGSQLYPFPVAIGRPVCDIFPGLGFSIFFSFEKTAEYDGAFLRFPVDNHLETNFFLGGAGSPGA